MRRLCTDARTASYTNTIGAAELGTVWRDPDDLYFLFLQKANCGPIGRCFHDESEFCVVQDYFQAAPGCLEDPYTGCDIQCVELFDTEPGPNVGDPCASDDDCDGGTICKSSCNLSELWLTSFCFTDPTCQW